MIETEGFGIVIIHGVHIDKPTWLYMGRKNGSWKSVHSIHRSRVRADILIQNELKKKNVEKQNKRIFFRDLITMETYFIHYTIEVILGVCWSDPEQYKKFT